MKKRTETRAKSKDRNDAEHYKGIIRAQKSQIRNLQKELNRLMKRKDQYEAIIDEEPIEEYLEEEINDRIEASKSRCPKCKGETENISLGNRILMQCECGWRKTIKQ